MIRRFNRFELKYLVSAATADALREDLRPYVVPDPEGGDTGTYQVTSLYYDTPDLQFFRSKIEGIKYRRKLRVRCYGTLGVANPPTAVEIKQRINRTTQKRRLPAPLDRALALCAGEGELPAVSPEDAPIAAEIEYLVRALRLAPTCVISYTRQALMGTQYEPGLRVTLDRGLWCREPTYGFAASGPRRQLLPAGVVVLEVKANDAVPLWMSHMLAKHACALRRYSKYCAGLAHLLEAKPMPAATPELEPAQEGRRRHG